MKNKNSQPIPVKPMKLFMLQTALISCSLLTSAALAQTDMSSMPGMGHGSMQRTPQSTPAEPAPSGTTERPGVRTPGEIAMPGTGMAMADNDIFYQVLFDKLEHVRSRPGSEQGAAWDAQVWVGRDINKLWLKTEGQRITGKSTGWMEALWSRATTAFWDTQLGVRQDFGAGKNRQWLAVGVQGITPYLFDVEATAYAGPSGRTAARFKANYSFRLTQRAFLTPEIETNLYGKADRERSIGSGFSDVALGLRLRYEIRREIAPYIGFSWGRSLGQTADFARQAGRSPTERQLVAGVRVWF